MKKLYLFLIIIVLGSCVTAKVNDTLEPLWFDSSYEYLSSERYIVFTAKGSSLIEAEDKIQRQAEFLKNYIQPVKEKDFFNKNGEVYLLYSIEKSELKSAFFTKIDEYYRLYSQAEMNGDSSSSILKKIKYYKEAYSIYNNMYNIIEFASSVELELDISSKFNITDLQDKINFTKSEVVFAVTVAGDINGAVESVISRELHRLGYTTSNSGIVQIDAELTLTEVDLDNNYVNKYWGFKLSINNLYGDSGESLDFNGRESQIDNDALNQLIIRVISSKIIATLKEIIP